jgi:hypothetical protein
MTAFFYFIIFTGNLIPYYEKILSDFLLVFRPTV